MPVFDVSGFRAPAATQSPMIITGSATLRPQITHARVSTEGVPSSEANIQVAARPSTAAGTSTAVTPRPKNGVSVAGSSAGTNCTVEPTYTAGQNLLMLTGSPRNLLQWWSYDYLAALVAIAASSNGIGFQTVIAGGALTNIHVDVDLME